MVKPWPTIASLMFLVANLVAAPAADRRANAENPPPHIAGALDQSSPGPESGASPAEKQHHEVKLIGQGTYQYYAVAIQDKYAYALNGSRLTVLDISVPTSPNLVGQAAISFRWGRSYPSTGLSIAVSGNFAYVGDGLGLHIIGVSNPGFPVEMGFYLLPRPVAGIAISGKYVYAATLDYGLRVVDVFDPSTPVEAGHFDVSSSALGVVLAGANAYLIAQDGLHILSLSDPAMPAEVGFLRTATKPSGVDVSGNRAYLAEAAGLRIIDVSNVASPAALGLYGTTGEALGVLVSGLDAYLIEGSSSLGRDTTIPGGLRIIDVSNPASPTRLSKLDLDRFDNPLLAISGAYLYGASSRALQIINVSDSSNPSVALAYGKDALLNYDSLAVAGGYAYASGFDSLRVFDVTNPAAPAQVGAYDRAGAGSIGRALAIAGDYVYWAAGNAGLLIVSVSDPTNPFLVGSYQMPAYLGYPVGYAGAVVLVGSLAYVAGNTGFRIVDVSNPAKPVEAGHYDTPGMVRDMALAGRYAVLAEDGFSAVQPGFFSGLRVIDISDRTTPVSAGFYRSPQNAFAVTVAGNYAYLATYGQGLRIVDLSNPAAPAAVGAYTGIRFARSVAVAGKRAYVVSDLEGLRVLDVSDPGNPVEVGSSLLRVKSVEVSGDFIYVVGGPLSILWLEGSGPTTAIPDLTVSQVASRDSLYPGDALSYLITMENRGATYIPLTITDTLPVNTSFISGTLSAGAVYSESVNSVLWSGVVAPGLSSLPSGSIAFRVEVSDVVSGGGFANSTLVKSGLLTGMTGTSTTVFRRTFLPLASKGTVGW